MSEEEKKKLVLDNISKEALVDRVMFFFEREKYYRERTYDLEDKIGKAIEILRSMKHCELLLGGYEKSNVDKLLEILGDKE